MNLPQIASLHKWGDVFALLLFVFLGFSACQRHEVQERAVSSSANRPELIDLPVSSGFGESCGQNAACKGDELRCFSDAEGYPEGMCARTCRGGCGRDALCVMAEPFAQGESGVCAPVCSASVSCRPGYVCRMRSTGRWGHQKSVCVPDVDDWSGQSACQVALDELNVVYRPVDHLADRADFSCEIEDPVLLAPEIAGVLFLRKGEHREPLLVGCKMALALEKMSRKLRTRGVVGVDHYGTYVCRAIRGSRRPSMHASGAAIDVAGLTMENGARVSVLNDWERGVDEPRGRGAKLLRSIARELHTDFVFNVVLTPEYNEGHHDHFHLDLSPGKHFWSQSRHEMLQGVGD